MPWKKGKAEDGHLPKKSVAQRSTKSTGYALSLFPFSSSTGKGRIVDFNEQASVQGRHEARTRRRAGVPHPDWERGGSLDSTTNNCATPTRTAFLGGPIDHSTGEVFLRWDPFRKWQLQAAGKKLLTGHRLGVCMAAVRPDWKQVEVRQSSESGRCYYSGLLACGSVWVCPVCASKIQQVRAAELRQAIAVAGDRGLQVAMLTLTAPHDRHDDLRELLGGFTGALGALTRGRAWTKELRPAYGIAGYVRALEVTWGEASGWHPHAHVLLFLRRGARLEELANALFPSWETAVKNRGLGQVNRAAFSLQDASHASRYVAKLGSGLEWGAAEELVRSHTKSAGAERYSPFDLLGEYAYPDVERGNPARFGALFREYAAVFHGRRQLQWSQGLKRQLLGTDGATDAEIADSLGELDEILATLTVADWSLVRRHSMRGELLLVAELHGPAGVRHLLSLLEARATERRP